MFFWFFLNILCSCRYFLANTFRYQKNDLYLLQTYSILKVFIFIYLKKILLLHYLQEFTIIDSNVSELSNKIFCITSFIMDIYKNYKKTSRSYCRIQIFLNKIKLKRKKILLTLLNILLIMSSIEKFIYIFILHKKQYRLYIYINFTIIDSNLLNKISNLH